MEITVWNSGLVNVPDWSESWLTNQTYSCLFHSNFLIVKYNILKGI